MRSVFLGKPSHWLALIIVAILLWFVGSHTLHVTGFNTFLCIVGALALALVSLVVFGHRSGEQPMREPLHDEVRPSLAEHPVDEV